MVARKSDQSSIKPRILSITFRTFCIKYPSLKIPEGEGYLKTLPQDQTLRKA